MARRQKTEIIDFPGDQEKLPCLTERQMSFVHAICEGKGVAEAYRMSYSTENMGQASVWTEASKLKASPKISLWLEQAQMLGMMKAVRSREQHIQRLQELSMKAEKSGNLGAAVQAEQLVGKVEGHYVEKVQDVTDYSADNSLLDELKQLLGEEAANKAAKELGYLQ